MQVDTDKKALEFDAEGEKIINQQINEAYQSGVIDNVNGTYNVFNGEKQPPEHEDK
jgi:hypothetical protein